MTNATFYYNVPTPNQERSFLQKVFQCDEKRLIENINSLVSKLGTAKKELSNDSRWGVHCLELNFPIFSFNIDSKSNLYLASEKLFEITAPIFPYLVNSNKEGYDILERFLKNNYAGKLKKQFLVPGKKIILPKA
ncbi:MAG TPA: hypothetical protein VJB35_04400 [Candidatus Nanoarchaeia archaeon]|nr:hypothetical protein [Candidatus Nanoarchaeia archaeon]